MCMLLDRLAQVIATFFYVGYIPVLPGTMGSFAGLIMWWLLPPMSLLMYVLLLGVLFFIGVWASSWEEYVSGKKDPCYIVIDEVVGMGVSLLLVPKNSILYVVAFLLFRFFDISKIFPINVAEKKLKRGWG